MINEEVIYKIKEKLDLIEVYEAKTTHKVEKKGKNLMGVCPFCGYENFAIYKTGCFYCFDCEIGGDVFTLYSHLNGLCYEDTINELAKICGFEKRVEINPEKEIFNRKYHTRAAQDNYWLKNLPKDRIRMILSRYLNPEEEHFDFALEILCGDYKPKKHDIVKKAPDETIEEYCQRFKTMFDIKEEKLSEVELIKKLKEMMK